ncbi:serine/threonine-protein kinase [Streptomyces sp. G45]|uniref:serine/threonine-protein kinase n=1 Tax=Streptomyces sp. G45 TaxID=3406627 RepID=UPI003C1D4A39
MGEVFAGRYELVDPVGRGGVGAVWRAWDHRRRRYVAAKVLQQRDAHTLLRFVREQALRIDHPHVLAPASWAADDDQVLFTMDLVTGGSLAHVIGDYGALPPRFCCTLLDQLLAGLAAVHAENVVHRDIKPANILLEATGTGRPHLRLSDFGIAMRKGEPRLTKTDYVVGTPGYFAPEQMMGAEPDFTADLFAVGLVALHLLQGAKPDAKALIEHFAEHGTPGAPEGVPEPLWQVIATLLQPDPQARFRTATGARKALASAAEVLPEPGPDDELVEIFDQLGPLPTGFGPDGPLTRAPQPPPASPPAPRQAAPQQPATPPSGMLPSGSLPPAPPGASTGTPLPGTPPPGPPPSAPPRPAAQETGSFHLAPPRQPPPQPTQPPTPPTPTPLPASAAAPPPTPTPPPPPTPTPPPPAPPAQAPPQPPLVSTPQPAYAHAPASQYTGQVARVPSPGTPIPAFPHHVQAKVEPLPPEQAVAPERPRARTTGSRTTGSHAARSPRTGPPAKVALPMLLAALLCFAVGFWALTQI